MEGTQTNNTNKDKKKKVRVKKVKPPKPIYNEFVYSPSLQKSKRIYTILGFIGRALIIYLGVLGMTLFLTNAFKVTVNTLALMAVTAFIVALFSCMALSKLTLLCGLGISAAAILIWAIASGNPLSAFMNSVGTLWNHMLDRLDFVGYRISQSIYMPVDTTTIFTDKQIAGYMFTGVVIMTIIFAVIFTLSIIKRIRILPILITSAIVLTIVFTYNISSSNWGFVLILCSFCGILTLKMYDNIYNRRRPLKDMQTNAIPQKGIRTAAFGGLAGIAVSAVCFVLMLIPALTCEEQWQTISFINDKMEYARAVVSSVILGETPDVDFGFIGNMDTMNSRSTIANERTYTGAEMLQIYTSYNMPMYLRSWIASSYDNSENSWNTVPTSKVAQYSSWFYNGFSPEVITYNFYNLLNPKLTNVNSYTSYSNHIEEGFVTETIDVQNINSSGNLLFLAATYNPEYGLMKYMATDKNELYDKEWKFYYEGIVTTSWFNLEKEYRFTAFVPSYRYETYSDRIADNLQYYSVMKYYITQYNGVSTDANTQAAAIKSAHDMLDSYGIEYTSPTAIERYFELDDAGRTDFMYRYFTLPDYYANFVQQEYLSVPDSAGVQEAAQAVAKAYYETTGEDYRTVSVGEDGEVTSEVFSYTGMVDESVRHNVVLAVVDYLVDSYEYTLDPKTPRNTRMSALDAFLTDTKEGYCVQFATSAAMILREIGIPTRYVEGYLVNNLKYDKSEDRLAKYSQVVHDYNAHAWIEVYMGALGWMTYETTPDYYGDLYEPYESSSSTTPYTPPEIDYETTAPETLPEEEEPEVVEEGGIKISAQTIMTIILIVIAAGAVAIPIYLIFKHHERSVRAYEKRYEIMNRAMRSKLPNDELRETARALNDYIWQLHEVAGCTPEVGELPDQYIKRVDDTINASLFSFRDILSYMNREEFGYGMARWQLREEAEYMQVLWEKLYAGMSKTQRFIWRNIKRKV